MTWEPDWLRTSTSCDVELSLSCVAVPAQVPVTLTDGVAVCTVSGTVTDGPTAPDAEATLKTALNALIGRPLAAPSSTSVSNVADGSWSR